MKDDRSLAHPLSRRARAFLDEIGQAMLVATIALVIVVGTSIYHLLMRYRARIGQREPPEELEDEESNSSTV